MYLYYLCYFSKTSMHLILYLWISFDLIWFCENTKYRISSFINRSILFCITGSLKVCCIGFHRVTSRPLCSPFFCSVISYILAFILRFVYSWSQDSFCHPRLYFLPSSNSWLEKLQLWLVFPMYTFLSHI